ncbi:gp16 family protein [Caldimonas sp. KR1-144]|uniref:gp16 family protein n=1 Tax=Caldimonas sp. KR1-144 TaxID=3400911 RepID=UPI003BFF046F
MSTVVDQEGARRADLAKIHLAKKDLGWDDDFYRSILWSVCRVKSSAELDFTGRKRLLEHMRRCGWKAKRGKSSRPMADDDQSKMIRGLWLELHELEYVTDSSEAALASWIKRETRVEALQWLSPAQRQQTIEKLKRWRDRDAKKLRTLALVAFNRGRLSTSDIEELAAAWFGSPRLTKGVAGQMLARLQMEADRG